jgi:hypothetical protein
MGYCGGGICSQKGRELLNFIFGIQIKGFKSIYAETAAFF